MTFPSNIKSRLGVYEIKGAELGSFNDFHFDSRLLQKNDVFVAIKGVQVDGHNYIDASIKRGATVIICETLPSKINPSVSYVKVEDTKLALAQLSSLYFDLPSSKIKLIGITGTNGKTSVVILAYNVLKKLGVKVGLISTISIQYGDTIIPSSHTTPDSKLISFHLNEMVKQGFTHCFMEVSSHGIALKRVAELKFAGGVFTNLSHDHLDFHNSYKEYRDVKKEFFDSLPKQSFALTNVDDKNGNFMLQNTKALKRSYSMKSDADYNARLIENSFEGMKLEIQGQELWVQLVGKFNAYNLVTVYSIACELGFDKLEVLQALSTTKGVNGRFETIKTPENSFVVVDFAHTPDALKNVLETISQVKHSDSKVTTVVGCGGDRDVTKRPIMGSIADALSDRVILTSDNPRTEVPEAIIDEIESGIKTANRNKVLRIVSRKEAIKTALLLTNTNDVLLIAGKGHENYQEINKIKYPFSDVQVVKEILNLN